MYLHCLFQAFPFYLINKTSIYGQSVQKTSWTTKWKFWICVQKFGTSSKQSSQIRIVVILIPFSNNLLKTATFSIVVAFPIVDSGEKVNSDGTKSFGRLRGIINDHDIVTLLFHQCYVENGRFGTENYEVSKNLMKQNVNFAFILWVKCFFHI